MLFRNTYPVTCHTDHVEPKSTFVAIKGTTQDGTAHIDVAIQRGASTIVVQKNTPLKQFPNVKYIFVDDCRIALAELAGIALGYPAQKLKFIGVTGTCGKTTTTFLVEHILKTSGCKTALLGSVKNKILDDCEEALLTTQTSDYVQMFLAECVKKGVEYVVMEVSSHGLALNRVHGIDFDVVGFTNLSSEHMDFHPTLEHYFQTKFKLFDQLKRDGISVINTDDSWGVKAYELIDSSKIGFGQNTILDVKMSIIKNGLDELNFSLSSFGKNLITEKLLGEFNAYNISMASLICRALGVAQSEIVGAIANFGGVPGRLQSHRLKNGATAFVDYAHKPDAMENVLKTLRQQTKDLIVVFGCGGDRDRTKRPVMGRIATQYADKVIITDDNPRSEDRQIIVDEIIAGISESKIDTVMSILNRAMAIERAVQISKSDSIIAILGKGHEKYILENNKKYNFDDFEEISRY